MPISRRMVMTALPVLVMTLVARAEQRIAFTTIAQGEDSAITAYTETVVRAPSEWQALWQKHTAGRRTAPALPAVDFSRSMVIAVFFGSGPVGRRAAILHIIAKDGRLVVLLQTIGPPGPESDALPQSTPFQIVRVPRTPLPVVFVRAKVPALYQPGP